MEAIIGAHILLFSHDIEQGAILTFEPGVALHLMMRFVTFLEMFTCLAGRFEGQGYLLTSHKIWRELVFLVDTPFAFNLGKGYNF